MDKAGVSHAEHVMVKGNRSPVDTRGLSGKGSGDCDTAVTYHWACKQQNLILKQENSKQ